MKSEMEYMCDEPPEFTTTKTRMMAAIRRKTDNVEAIVQRIAENIDKQNSKSNTWRDGFLRGIKQFITVVDPEWKDSKKR
jgi:hypothetical protein